VGADVEQSVSVMRDRERANRVIVSKGVLTPKAA
jgi:hypothetical protein